MEPSTHPIPRLVLSSKHSSIDQNSARSDFEDLFSTTQRFDGEENVGIQIDRLNQILETVLLTINEESSSMVKLNDVTIETEKCFSEVSTQTGLNLVAELKKKDNLINSLNSQIFAYKTTRTLPEFIQKFEEMLLAFIEQTQVQYPNSNFSLFLSETLNNCKCFSEPFQDFSFKIDSPDVSCISSTANTSLELYKRSVQYLSKQFSNLTSTSINFSGSYPELELPEFISSVLAEVSFSICKEKQSELNEKREKRFDLTKKTQIVCTFEEIQTLHSDLTQILSSMIESGIDSEYPLQLGLLNISLNIYFSDESKAKMESDPKIISYFQSFTELKKKNQFKEFEKGSEMDLREKLEEKEKEFESCHLMWNGVQEAAQKRIEELETCVDELMFQIDVKEKQLRCAKPENIGIISYADKLQELREKESVLKTGYEKLELERQKLVKQTVDFYCNKQVIDLNQSNQETLKTREVGEGTNLEIVDKFVQTETEKIEESDDLDELTAQLYENYSKLEQLGENETSDSVVESIKRIKKRINELHTKQALIFTEQSIDYAESKLKVIEKELQKGFSGAKTDEKELEMYRKENLKLKNDLADLQALIKSTETQLMDQERVKLFRDRINLQQQEEKFNKKRKILKQKIEQVNLRQRKITELEENLNEKKIQISIQAKKQECFKQAIEEEWGRVDKKRQEVLKCQKMIDEEWKTLLAETSHFESLKKEDKNQSGYKPGTKNMMEKLSQLEENALKDEIQYNQLENLKKKLEDEKNRISDEWKKLNEAKEKTENEKNLWLKQSQELESQLNLLNKEKIVLKENKLYINSFGPRLKKTL